MRKNTTQGKHAWMSVSRATRYILNTTELIMPTYAARMGSTSGKHL